MKKIAVIPCFLSLFASLPGYTSPIPLNFSASLTSSSCTVSFDHNSLIFPAVALPLSDGDSWEKGDVTARFDNCPKKAGVTLTVQFPVIAGHDEAVSNQGSGGGIYMRLDINPAGGAINESVEPQDGGTMPDYLENARPYNLITNNLFGHKVLNIHPLIMVSQPLTGETPAAGHFLFPVNFVFNFS
jgi:hypothetical protein